MTPQTREGWPPGGGANGALIRAPGFQAAGLGLASTWSENLRACVGLVAASSQAMFVAWGPELALLYNDAYGEILAERHPAALGRPLAEVWSDLWPRVQPVAERTLAGEAVLYDTLFLPVRRGGAVVETWCNFSYTPVRDADGQVAGLFCSIVEVTRQVRAEAELRALNETLERRVAEAVAERRQAELALQQAQKMESLGQLTGGVAHDFNNLLQVVSGNLELLAKDVAGNARAERRVTNALAGVSRGAKLASQLLAFGRRQPLDPRALDVGRLVADMDDMLRRSLGEGVEVKTAVCSGLWTAFADPAQLENALLNLAINGRDAMDGRGRLTIEAANAALDAAYAQAQPDMAAGQYVTVAVTDTGSGMTPQVLAQVFEPFFSTKPEGKGTGLGLSMVYGFAKQSGGHVMIDSEPGQGTTVTLYLPRTLQAEEVAAPLPAAPGAGGSETILVAEDDGQVRATVVETLRDCGYRVLEAADAESALAMIENGAAVDLLFTDVVMPGLLASSDMARRACQRLPNLAVLFTSGYTQDTIVHGGRLDAGVELLSKPYDRETLARKVRHVLANPPRLGAASA